MLSPLENLAASITYPPYLSVWLMLLAGLVLALRRRKAAAAIAALAILWSAAWSIPMASDWLRSGLEDRYARVPESSLPQADAIVVLGGGHHYGWLDREQADPYMLESSRLAGAARAWLAARAPYVVLSGAPVEVRTMRQAIARLGIPDEAVLVESRSLNTRQNAEHTAALARTHGFKRVILTTSALHMPRAMLQFGRAGLDAVPLPIREGARRNHWRERWLPSKGALWRSGRAFKEYAGIAAAWAATDATARRNCTPSSNTGAAVACAVTQAASPCCAASRRGDTTRPPSRPSGLDRRTTAGNAATSRSSIPRGPS